jgi:hypothetical membrane protein
MRLIGATGTTLFWLTLCVVSVLTPGYSNVSQHVSVLGAVGSPYGVWMNWLGIMPFALAMLITGISMIVDRPRSISAWSGGALLALGGVVFAIAGLNPCDVGCQPSELPSGQVHRTVAPLGFTLVPLAALVHGLASLRRGADRGFHLFSLILGTAMLCSLMVVLVWLNPQGEFGGLLQRVTLLLFSIWIFGLSIRLHDRRLGTAGDRNA